MLIKINFKITFILQGIKLSKIRLQILQQDILLVELAENKFLEEVEAYKYVYIINKNSKDFASLIKDPTKKEDLSM